MRAFPPAFVIADDLPDQQLLVWAPDVASDTDHKNQTREHTDNLSGKSQKINEAENQLNFPLPNLSSLVWLLTETVVWKIKL